MLLLWVYGWCIFLYLCGFAVCAWLGACLVGGVLLFVLMVFGFGCELFVWSGLLDFCGWLGGGLVGGCFGLCFGVACYFVIWVFGLGV